MYGPRGFLSVMYSHSLVLFHLLVAVLRDASGQSPLSSLRLTRAFMSGMFAGEAVSLAQGSVNDINLVNFHDAYYYATILVGSPGQPSTVIFDTGSCDLWVPSAQICTSNAQYCRNHHTYNHDKSITYRANGKAFRIVYGSGTVTGFSSRDSFVVGGLQTTGVLFGEANQIDASIAKLTFDGIFGLAYPALCKAGNPPFLSMVAQHKVGEPVFSLFLNRDSSPGYAELALGGIDPSHYTGQITYTPVTEKKYWKIKLQRIMVGSVVIAQGTSAFPDSGSSLLFGPAKIMNAINQRINARPTGTGKTITYSVNCATAGRLPAVTFVISGTMFSLNPDEYIFQAQNSNGSLVCITGFVSTSRQPDNLILGEPFMRKFYTVFDMGKNQVGFALAT